MSSTLLPKFWQHPSVVARSLAGMLTPDPLATDETSDGIMAMNTDIQVSESAYYPLTPEQLAEGDMTQERT